MSRISVVVCTYNGARYLRQQLESIIGQTRPPDQIVVSDDGSSDGSLELARRTLTDWPGEPVLVSNPGPRGVVTNFQYALGHTTGELVALSDQDDLWHPEKLATFEAAFAEASAVVLAHSDARLVDASGGVLPGTLLGSLTLSARDRRALENGPAIVALLRRNFVTGATTVLRRSLLETALPVPEAWLHDEWFAMIAAATGRLRLIGAPLIDYRQHGANEVGARQLGVAAKVQRMSEPRRERNARLLRRAEQLTLRLEPLGEAVHPGVLDAARQKLEHERMRSALPATRLARLPRVLHAVCRGRYSRYGRGALDAVRDLIQPD